MITAYRVHSGTESPETVLDPARPDGWVASDEWLESQPHGVSCCLSLRDLLAYVAYYSLCPQPGDVVLALSGRLGGQDRDQHAARLVVESYDVLWPAAGMVEAARHLDAADDLAAGRSAERVRGDYDMSDDAWAWIVRAAEAD